MKNLILLLSILVLFTSCMTDKQIIRNREHVLQVLKIKEGIVYKDTTIYKDRLVYVNYPKDTSKIDVPIMVKPDGKGIVPLRPITVKNGLAGATAWVDSTGLHVRAYLTKTVEPIMIHDTIKIEGAIQVITKEIPVPKKLGWYARSSIWVTSILLAVLALILLWKFGLKFFPQTRIIQFLKAFIG